jgi:hypothetical protein
VPVLSIIAKDVAQTAIVRKVRSLFGDLVPF